MKVWKKPTAKIVLSEKLMEYIRAAAYSTERCHRGDCR